MKQRKRKRQQRRRRYRLEQFRWNSQRNATPEALGYRTTSVTLDGARAKTIDEKERSIEAVLSTENPVRTFDRDRYELVPEVLLNSGMNTPRSGQVPLVDNHNYSSVANVLGSVRGIEKVKGETHGRLFFARDEASETAFGKARDGHSPDVSVGYRVNKRTYIPKGQTQRIEGRNFEGPVNVVTDWDLREVSMTPIGADEQAKMRGLSPEKIAELQRRQQNEGSLRMNPELLKKLIARGMPADVCKDPTRSEDVAKALAWMAENPSFLEEKRAECDKEKERKKRKPMKKDPPEEDEEDDEEDEQVERGLNAADVDKIVKRALKTADDQRRAEAKQRSERCESLLKIAGLEGRSTPEEIAFADSCRSIEDENELIKKIQDERAKRSERYSTPLGPSVAFQMGAAQRDKHRAAVGTALMMRAAGECHLDGPDQVKKFVPEEQRAKGWEDFRHARLIDIARECMLMDGARFEDLRGKADWEVAMMAMASFERFGTREDFAGAYNVTGSFPKLTLDAINKSMMLGFQQIPPTWRGPMSVGQPARDFKTIHRIQLGAVPNLQIWNDVTKHAQASFADEEEKYAVEARSTEIEFSYKLLVNDDMNALSRTPQKLGDAAGRTLNAVAWSNITGNPTMRDGVALFSGITGNRLQTNLVASGSGAAPSVATRQVLVYQMGIMRGTVTPEGKLGDDILGLRPTYIVSGLSLETTVLQLVKSSADPSQANPAVFNPGYNTLIPVFEPLLDLNSTTAWYLFASPSRVETVEITFLQGLEEPRIVEIPTFDRFSRKYVILHVYGSKALDWRGVQQNAGA